MSGSASAQEPSAETHTCAAGNPDQTNDALSKARAENSCFFLDNRLTWRPVIRPEHRELHSSHIVQVVVERPRHYLARLPMSVKAPVVESMVYIEMSLEYSFVT
jgi:hypothetical protein